MAIQQEFQSLDNNFDKLNLQVFDFTNGFNCSDVHRFKKLDNFSVKTFELNFYHDQIEWNHIIEPIEVGENDSDRVLDLLIYKNHYVLNKAWEIFLGNHNCNFVCRICLRSFPSRNVLMKHRQRCDQQEITSIRTSNECHLYWKKKHFHKDP